jgi:bis(5'-nucleosyl)-tetraphosphatase (symmetrical)
MISTSRRFIVGDIHGCVQELNNLLKEFQFSPSKDQLYSVGDVMGKGPYPLESLKLLKYSQAKIVLGNHEVGFLRGLHLPIEQQSHWHKKYIASLGKEVEYWKEEMQSWPYYIEEEDIIIVHAGLEPGISKLKDMDPDILTRIRLWKDPSTGKDSPWFNHIYTTKKVIFGHWAAKGLVNMLQFKGLDTGCVYGNGLTGYCPEEDKLYHVPSLNQYCKI